MKQLSKNELSSILEEVQTALNGEVQTEAKKISALAKAHPGEDTSSEVAPDESATSPAAPDASASPAPDASASPADGSAPPSDAPPADASASPAGPTDGSAIPDSDGDADGGGTTDPQALEAAYAQLPLPELQLHYLAAKAALVAASNGADGSADGSAPPAPDAGAPPPAGPPAGPDASASPAGPPAPDASAPPIPPPAMKTEKGTELPYDTKANGERPTAKSEKDIAIASLGTLRKSEKDIAIESLTKSKTDTDAAIATLVSAVKDFVEKPVRKAIISTSDLPKSKEVNLDSLTKKEVNERLKKIAEKPTLTKSDRSNITSYALGNVNLDAVRHLLVETK